MYTFNKRMHDLQFHTNVFSIIRRVNYNPSVIESKIQCDLAKQPGKIVSIG